MNIGQFRVEVKLVIEELYFLRAVRHVALFLLRRVV